MAYVTDDLITYLGDHASVSPLITTDPLHIFAEGVPEIAYSSSGRKTSISNTYILLEEGAGDKVRDMQGFTGVREMMFTIRVVAPSKLEIRRIFHALDDALEVHFTQMGDFYAYHSFLDEPEDTSTTAGDGSGGRVLEMSASLELMGRLN